MIQHNLPPRHKPRVRVTTDQRTNEVLARIVKCRVADLNVYSPRTCLDWRVSVNLEMNYDGDMSELIPIPDVGGGSARRGGGGGSGSGHREKDRMSYRHLAYQIDLTQVGTSEVLCFSPFPLPLFVSGFYMAPLVSFDCFSNMSRIHRIILNMNSRWNCPRPRCGDKAIFYWQENCTNTTSWLRAS